MGEFLISSEKYIHKIYNANLQVYIFYSIVFLYMFELNEL